MNEFFIPKDFKIKLIKQTATVSGYKRCQHCRNKEKTDLFFLEVLRCHNEDSA